MKWMNTSLEIAKTAAITLATYSLVMSPITQAASSTQSAGRDPNFNIDKNLMQEFLHETGWSKKHRMTVGEFYSKVRRYYPKTLQEDMDRMVAYNRNELMPTMEMTTFKDASGKEQVRLIASDGGRNTTTFSFNTDSEKAFLKVDNTTLSRSDLLYHERMLVKVAKNNKTMQTDLKKPMTPRLRRSIVLSYEEFTRLTPYQRAEYFVLLRQTMEAARDVRHAYDRPEFSKNDGAHDYFAQLLMGLNAYAQDENPVHPGAECWVAGHLSMYGNRYCGETGPARDKLNAEIEADGDTGCPSNAIPCKSLVYGRNTDGNPFCVVNDAGKVKHPKIKYATPDSCENASPLKTSDDKKRIIESMMKARGVKGVDLKFRADGLLPKSQYTKEVQQYVEEENKFIQQSIDLCTTGAIKEVQDTVPDQKAACQALAKRKITIETYGTEDSPAPVPPATVFCDPGKHRDNMGACVCDTGSQKVGNGGNLECAPDEVAPVEKKKDDKCSQKGEKQDSNDKNSSCSSVCWPCILGIGAVVLLGVGAAIYFSHGHGGNSSPPAPPKDPCPPAPIACTGTTTTTTTTAPPAPVQSAPPAPTVTPVVGIPLPSPVPVTTPNTVLTEGGQGTNSTEGVGGIRGNQ